MSNNKSSSADLDGRMDLSRSPEDGSLLTAPLHAVLTSATDALYDDLHNMTNGEIPTVSSGGASAASAEGGGQGEGHQTSRPPSGGGGMGSPQPSGTYPNQPPPGSSHQQAGMERMANLSFARRRHELGVRIARHGRAATHLAALVAAYCDGDDDTGGQHGEGNGSRHGKRHRHDSPKKRAAGAGAASTMGETVALASRALKHVQSSWLRADEAQDAMYFAHGTLWRGRRHPHDVSGALDLVSGGGTWGDMSKDVELVVDGYEISEERERGAEETRRRLQSAVRRKLVLGEVGKGAASARLRQGGDTDGGVSGSVVGGENGSSAMEVDGEEDEGATVDTPCPWRIILERNGCAVRLTYGNSRRGDAVDSSLVGGATAVTAPEEQQPRDVYPIEARVTVLSEEENAEWTLLSVDIRVHPKTGESSHQLEPNNRQRFDLHRLCAKAMRTEEERARKEESEAAEDGGNAAERGGEAKKDVVMITAKKSLGKSITNHGNAADGGGNDGGESGGVAPMTKEEESLKSKAVGNDIPNGGAYGPKRMDIDGDVETGSAARSKDVNDARSSCGDGAMMMTVPASVGRPLDSLFEVAHTFATSLQLEMLSSQSVALKRGAWGDAGGGGGGTGDLGIDVSPIRYVDTASRSSSSRDAVEGGGTFKDKLKRKKARSAAAADASCRSFQALAVLGIHFWACDDRFGAPKIEDLSSGSQETIVGTVADDNESTISASSDRGRDRHGFFVESDRRADQRLSLCIRAVPRKGLFVSLSGGAGVMSALLDEDNATSSGTEYLRRNLDKLLSSIRNPFQLSASDALLAATSICAHGRCMAVLDALRKRPQRAAIVPPSGERTSLSSLLPAWLHLSVERGAIAVAADISYGEEERGSGGARLPVLLFRVACDSRTGRFIAVFPRPASLLRALACNDPSASDLQQLRTQSLSSKKRRNASASFGKELTGRIVKDAFDGLHRSMDVLGRRAGVGGGWNNKDGMSGSLRERSIEQASVDVRTSLVSCCGMAVVYGVGALALGVATSVEACADMGGEAIEDTKDSIPSPPLCIVLSQNILEKTATIAGDEIKKISILQRDLFAVGGSVNSEKLCIRCFHLSTEVEKPNDIPKRSDYTAIPLEVGDSILDENINAHNQIHCQVLDEVKRLAPLFSRALGSLS